MKAQMVGLFSIEFEKQRAGEIVGVGHAVRGNSKPQILNLKMVESFFDY